MLLQQAQQLGRAFHAFKSVVIKLARGKLGDAGEVEGRNGQRRDHNCGKDGNEVELRADARASYGCPPPHDPTSQSIEALSEICLVASMTFFMAALGSPSVTMLSLCSIGLSVVSSGNPERI